MAAPCFRSTCSQAYHAQMPCKLRKCTNCNAGTSRQLTLRQNPWLSTTWVEETCPKKAAESRLGLSSTDTPPTLPITMAAAHNSTAVHNQPAGLQHTYWPPLAAAARVDSRTARTCRMGKPTWMQAASSDVTTTLATLALPQTHTVCTPDFTHLSLLCTQQN